LGVYPITLPWSWHHNRLPDSTRAEVGNPLLVDDAKLSEIILLERNQQETLGA